MNSVLMQAIFGIACIGFGFLAGLSLSWRRYRLAGKDFDAPALPQTEWQHALLLVVVALLSVVSAAYAGVEANKQSDCNEVFKQSLVARSAIATENQRHIDDVMAAIAEAVSTPQPDRARAVQAIVDYRAWSVSAERQRADNPIGDPQCGK